MDENREVLCVFVKLTETFQVKAGDVSARMLAFTGTAEGSGFLGRILPDAVDTQRIDPDGKVTLSARYMLEGEDGSGRPCHIFIEDNGTQDSEGKLLIHPVILTDSPELNWLNGAKLYGTIEAVENSGGLLRIHIYEKGGEGEDRPCG